MYLNGEVSGEGNSGSGSKTSEETGCERAGGLNHLFSTGFSPLKNATAP